MTHSGQDECPACGSADLIEWTMNGRVGMECCVCSHTWTPEVGS